MATNIKIARIVFAFLIGTIIWSACKKDNAAPNNNQQYDKDYYGRQSFIIALNGNYMGYDSALKITGLIDTLAQPGPYTTILLSNKVGWVSVNNGVILSFNPPKNLSFIMRSLIVSGMHSFKSLPVGANQVFTSLAGNHLYIGKYPITQDSMVYTVNGVRVTIPDVPTTNGPIEVIDSVIPNLETFSSVTAFVNGSQDLTFMALALKRTGLDKVLDGSVKGEWTLLAPYDGAFKKMTDPSLNSYDGILNADTAKLAKIIRYHIIPTRNFLFDFLYRGRGMDTLKLNTLQPQSVLPVFFKGPNWWQSSGYFFMGPGNWTDNGAGVPPTPNVATLYQKLYPVNNADMVTGNGVVHEIDNVLLP